MLGGKLGHIGHPSFGISLRSPLWHGLAENDFDTMKQMAVEGEILGFESLWMNDHHFPVNRKAGPFLECWTVLSALSSVTSKIRLGNIVLNNLYRHPALLAKMSATLDVISNGRLELGLGTGYREEEVVSYGVPLPRPSVRVERLRESIQIIKRIWRYEKATFEGKHYYVKDAINYLRPIQKPHPPIWIAGYNQRMMGLIAELADGCHYAMPPESTYEDCKQRIEMFDELCLELGRNPDQIRKSLGPWLVFIAESSQELRDRMKKFKREHWNSEFQNIPDEKDDEYFGRRYLFIVGDPQQCTEKIREYADLGITDIILLFTDIADMHMFAETVIPAFK